MSIDSPSPATSRVTSERLVGLAETVASTLQDAATRLPDGSLFWGRGVDRNDDPIDDNGPYNGRCGEALFFATLYAETGKASYRAAAEDTIQGLRTTLTDAEQRADLFGRLWFGNVGVGGMLYAVSRVAHLLDDAELLDGARALCGHVTPSYVRTDDVHDIQWGGAGLIMGLLALYESGHDAALDKAILCADHLLDTRERDESSGKRAWAVIHDVPATGFAHGASGIAHALLRVHAYTDAPQYYDAAIEAFDFERSLYVPSIRNWIDYHGHPDEKPVLCGWCHGGPGIGMARLTVVDHVTPEHEPDVAADLKRAIESTLYNQLASVDTLCCGRLGAIDFLFQASRALSNEALAQKAQGRLETLVDRVEASGFDLPDQAENLHESEGFWQSDAGAGYFMLQCNAPSRVPSVLTLSTEPSLSRRDDADASHRTR